jgi:eukaryotic-like serine/threonine-protein kinase
MPHPHRIGEYDVQELYATGGVTRFTATHAVLPRHAIIELVDSTTSTRSRAVKLMRHACILEALHHPGIPRVYECGMHEGRAWVAFQPANGVSLAVELCARRLSVREVTELVETVAAILAHAHSRGVLHRDITPSVIIRDDERDMWVVAGWTRACTFDTELAIPLHGSTSYRAPELANDDDLLDGRSDVYSLGAVAYEALTGEVPSLPITDVANLPGDLGALIMQMLSEDPLLRPNAAAVVAAAGTIADELVDEDDGSVDISFDDDTVIEPRRRSRWTPQWQLDTNGGTLVEIVPRRVRTHRDTES